MLQRQIEGKSTGNACEWKALSQGTTEGKQKNLSHHTSCEFYAYFSSQSRGHK